MKVSSSCRIGSAPVCANHFQSFSPVDHHHPRTGEVQQYQTSSYLVELLQLANDVYTEEEFVHTTLFQSMLHLLHLSGCCSVISVVSL